MLFNNVFKNEGISVIGVSIAVSVLCLPLYIVAEAWQQIQRDTEKRLEPGMKRIKETFKGDEQYMILSAFYKINHYHPLMALRSSFGLLIQIPFFMAAYSFLSNLPVLKGYSWAFIKDMGSQDAMFHIGSFPINVLPIAMTLINIIAGAIYTKGFKFKDKMTIYGMALVFLVILYNSPSGLVLYWTMNNIFSLVKNIFYKIKNPLKVLYLILVLCVVSVDIYVLGFHHGFLHKRLLLAFASSLLLLAPWALKASKWLSHNVYDYLNMHNKERHGLFFLSVLSITFLMGYVIPSSIISSSPIEFSDIDGLGNPIYFLNNSLTQMFGLFVFWMTCVYFLFNNKIQTFLSVIFTSLLFGFFVDNFIFGGDYGTLSRLITFDSSITKVPLVQNILNLIVFVIALSLPTLLLKFKLTKALSYSLCIILLAEVSVSGLRAFTITKGYKDYKLTVKDSIEEADHIKPVYHLSKTGKNVLVFMFDRGENSYVEPIFNAFPELYDSYTGFTLYRNTISYNQGTLLASPALYGGYEYTPYEMNKRDNVKLVDKQNEALLLLPRIFSEQGDFKATVSDLSWANYSWIPDMSITEPYPKIDGYNIERKYTSLWLQNNPDKCRSDITSSTLKRNLTWYSLFKCVPFVMRDSIYDDGAWWSSDETTSDIMEFIDYYSALDYMKELTDFTATGNVYCTITNDTTHSGQDLEAPEYYPTMHLTNVDELGLDTSSSQIAAFMRLGSWINHLKANDCYDNTRIIIVSDHGIGSDTAESLFEGKVSGWEDYNMDHLNCLLMVKDFNEKGKLQVNYDFMTNADVPSLALKNLIPNAKNPYTQKEIKTLPLEGKKAQGVVLTHNFLPGSNGQFTFKVPESDWYTVSDNIFHSKNWIQGLK